jgi:tRNA(fMet)-specific endonuclease VapC
MAGYLLDANIVSALMHEPIGRIAQRIARAGEGNVFTSVIVAAELAYGGEKKPSPRLAAALATVFRELDIKPLEVEAVRHYVRLRPAGTGGNANQRQ